MKLTKLGLAERIHKACGFTKADSKSLVEKLLRIIKNTLVNGEEVDIDGFGKFTVEDKKPRRTKKSPNKVGGKKVEFRSSWDLIERLNGPEWREQLKIMHPGMFRDEA